MHFCLLHNEKFLKFCFFLYTHAYITNTGKIWFGHTSPETASYFEISFSSFYGKNKVQAVIPVAAPVDGNKSDIGDGGDESDGSIESENEEERIESET